MTDDEVNYWTMTKEVRKLLQTARPQWEPLYKKMLPDYTRLDTALAGIDVKLQKVSGVSSTGYTADKDKAEIKTLNAALPLIKGMKALAHDGDYPGLKKMAKYTFTKLDKLRDSVQVAALEELHTQAAALTDDLAGEMVTTAQIKALDTEIKLYKPMVGTPHEQINAGSLLRDDYVKFLTEAKLALKGLDARVPNLESALPDLVAAYRKARQIIDAGHGPKGDAGQPA
jgi:hypothetical protein